jgi:hypothetical protein
VDVSAASDILGSEGHVSSSLAEALKVAKRSGYLDQRQVQEAKKAKVEKASMPAPAPAQDTRRDRDRRYRYDCDVSTRERRVLVYDVCDTGKPIPNWSQLVTRLRKKRLGTSPTLRLSIETTKVGS